MKMGAQHRSDAFMEVPFMARYHKRKVRLLKQFGIKLTDDQLSHLNSLETEIAVDNFAHSLICNKLRWKWEQDEGVVY